MTELQTLKSYLDHIQGMTPTDMATGEQCRDYLALLTSMLAYANERMADANRLYNIAKSKAYQALQDNITSKQAKVSVTLMKDYVSSLCSKEAYYYDMAERTSRAITHVIEAVRSILSSLKNERSFAQYGT